jgi:hypothetical protein
MHGRPRRRRSCHGSASASSPSCSIVARRDLDATTRLVGGRPAGCRTSPPPPAASTAPPPGTLPSPPQSFSSATARMSFFADTKIVRLSPVPSMAVHAWFGCRMRHALLILKMPIDSPAAPPAVPYLQPPISVLSTSSSSSLSNRPRVYGPLLTFLVSGADQHGRTRFQAKHSCRFRAPKYPLPKLQFFTRDKKPRSPPRPSSMVSPRRGERPPGLSTYVHVLSVQSNGWRRQSLSTVPRRIHVIRLLPQLPN